MALESVLMWLGTRGMHTALLTPAEEVTSCAIKRLSQVGRALGLSSTRLQGVPSSQDLGEAGLCSGTSRAADVTEVHRGPALSFWAGNWRYWPFWAGRQLETREQHGSPMAASLR